MKKKYFISLILTAGILVLSGCGSGDISDENSSLISEYAANAVLNHDSSYTDKKVSDVTTQEPNTSESSTQQATEASTQEPVTDGSVGGDSSSAAATTESTVTETTDISPLFETPDLTVSYDSYEVTDSYEKGATFLDSDKSSQLIVAHFTITNHGSDKQSVNFMDKAISYELRFNEEQTSKPMLTILEDDLSTYSGSIKAGKSKKAVLIFEVDKSLIASVDTVSMKTSYHGMDALIKMK